MADDDLVDDNPVPFVVRADNDLFVVSLVDLSAIGFDGDVNGRADDDVRVADNVIVFGFVGTVDDNTIVVGFVFVDIDRADVGALKNTK